MWEIHMLGLTRRELETDPRGTAPVLDPTDEAGTGNGLLGTAPVFDPTCEGLGGNREPGSCLAYSTKLVGGEARRLGSRKVGCGEGMIK